MPLIEVHPRDRAAWRAWLAEHHDRPEYRGGSKGQAAGVWLVFDKKASGQRRLTYAEAVEEALCFGWIDSRPNAIDEERYKQLYSPRKPGSAWSKINKQRVDKLIAAGLMTAAGLAKVEAARRDGSWSALDEVEDLEVPADLAAALAQSPRARRYFEAFPPSSKKIILWWIRSAKREATRAERVATTVSMAARNLRANHYRQPGESRKR
jgi:uncharacterized protein YdeI (YjbR/CyaY-like superfamily)